METENKVPSSDVSWILKFGITILALILTMRFTGPLSDAVSKGSGNILTGSLLSDFSYGDGTVQETADGQETEPENENESETETEHRENDNVVKENTEAYSTPPDVLRLEEEYIDTFSNGAAEGTVEEVFFRASGSTDCIDGIYIKNTTATKKPDFGALIDEGPNLTVKNKSEPTVLIFHTHTTESYLLSDTGKFYKGYETRSFDASQNMVRVGEEICKVLEANGIGFIHDKNIYDESYNGAYSRSRVTVEEYLEKYPTIKIVLDVHRDAIYYSDTSHCKPTAEINGRKAAQIMIITGAEEGYISDFPHWEDNLRFALCIQKTAEEKFPGLMKPLYFCQRKYNMDTSLCSVLLEIGTDANTLDEALYSAHMMGVVLSDIVNESVGE